MRARWTDSSREVTSCEDLLRVVDEVASRGEPTILFLEHERTTLAVGLGGPETVLMWSENVPSGDLGESDHSLGDPDREGFLSFRGIDSVDDFLAELAVPGSLSVPAILEFWDREGARPDVVRWESDWE